MNETPEDWSVVHGSPRAIHGGPVISECTIQLREPEEVIVWEILYQTVVDCHKIATLCWRHFTPMEWHMKGSKNLPERTIATAKNRLGEWIESAEFSLYLKVLGWNPDRAKEGLREVLEGKRTDEVESLIRQIAKERDARRNREVNP